MFRTLSIIALLGLSLTACKPTERKLPHRDHGASPAQTQDPEQTPPPVEQPADVTVQTAIQAPEDNATQETEPKQTTPAQSLMRVRSVQQDFNLLRPWEKNAPFHSQGSAVYMGDGKVLVSGPMLNAATYVELELPDGSRTVPARIVKYDADLGLGLVTVAHEEDASIFESRESFPLGDALHIGDQAQLWCVISGTMPASIDLRAESGGSANSMPAMNLKTAAAMPDDIFSKGAPVIKDGKLVAVSQSYANETQTLTCINADLIRRFLEENEESAKGAPRIGVRFDTLNDPVFRRYLKLENNQTGLYINDVLPKSAAEQVGIRKGDVLTAIEGMPLDNQGLCQHPIYGPTKASLIIRSLKPVGESLKLTISRNGETMELDLPLNRDAEENAIIGTRQPGVQPKYIMWGGLLFLPLTQEYLDTLSNQAHSLPVQFLKLQRDEKPLREKGITEAVALTNIIPTPATLGYEQAAFCIVEKVNGKLIHNFSEFEKALDEPTKDGIVELSIDRAPYQLYIDRQAAEAANDALHRNAIHRLRYTGAE